MTIRSLDTPRQSIAPRSLLVVGLLAILAYASMCVALAGAISYDVWGALIVGPVLIAVTAPALRRQAHRENDPALFRLLLVGLVAKVIIGAIARLYVAYDVYGGRADVGDYVKWGLKLYPHFRAGDLHTGLSSLTGSNFIRALTGAVYSVTGPTQLGGFMVFSWFGFLGLFFFYRAFTLAVPEGRNRTYARFLFFLPSLIFWPSIIGKDAWMMLSLGTAALGIGHLLSGRPRRGIVLALLGMWMASLVRPHVAAMVAVGLVAAFLFKRPSARWRELAPVVKGLTFAMVVGVAIVLILKTQAYLKTSFVQSEGGQALANLATKTAEQGQSTFAPSLATNPANLPMAVLTVLFRPLIIEAGNVQQVVAGLEGTILLILSLIRLPWIWAATRTIRRQPYVAFVAVYTGIFIVAFSAIANFGLLARERAQLFPVFLVLLCIPPMKRKDGESAPATLVTGTPAPIGHG